MDCWRRKTISAAEFPRPLENARWQSPSPLFLGQVRLFVAFFRIEHLSRSRLLLYAGSRVAQFSKEEPF